MKVKVNIEIEDDVVPNSFVLQRITEAIKEEMSYPNSTAYIDPRIVYCGCGVRLAQISLSSFPENKNKTQ